MKIERQLQGILNTTFTEIIRERKLENKLQPHATIEEGRADITIKNKNGKPVFFIELKDPTAKNGRSVFDSDTVLRELSRAHKNEIRYFGVCNFLACAFFDGNNINDKVSVSEGFFSIQEITRLSNNFLATKDIEKKLRSVAEFYIERALEIVEKKAITFSQPDELYIFKIRKLIEAYSFSVTDKVWEKYKANKKFEKEIQTYTTSQLWNNPKTYEEIENLTHIALLMLISKLIFYKAYVDNQTWHNLSPMQVDKHIDTAEKLENSIWQYFTEFKEVTGDYELLIGERSDIVFQIPFVSDAVIELVIDILDTGKYYDFSKIPYDIIGRIFEELIREDERHKLGQYFTPPHVIDLINAFAINNENDKVFDPSCGSGTFLVRAYERKKELSKSERGGTRMHESLLDEIYGNDLSGYPAYLSMLNLSIRNTRRKSYPRIINKDFFSLLNFTKVDLHNQKGESEQKQLPQFNAIIGNPPYTRQEDIGAMHGTVKKDTIQAIIKNECGFFPSQRTSIYAYFFYHAATFLKEGGYLAYIVQNSWLDTDYGVDLQQYLLRNFEIVAIMDSEVERFFPTASVNTSIVILRKQRDEDKRAANVVKFVYFKDTLLNALKFYKNADKLKNYIEKIKQNSNNDYININCLTQQDLTEEKKWSKFLKAPKVYFDILKKGKDKFKNLSTKTNAVSKIYYGLKSGCNDYFFGENITDTKEQKYLLACQNNIDKHDTITAVKKDKLIIFKNGFNECWLIEKEFIKKALTLTRDIHHYIIDDIKANDVIFQVNLLNDFKSKNGFEINKYRTYLKKNYPYAFAYILSGEKKKVRIKANKAEEIIVSELPSCSSRPAWFDLGEQLEKDFLLLQFRDKRNWTPIVNTNFLLGNVVFFGTFNNKKRKKLYALSLNSTFSILQSEMLGRVNLGDGLLTTYGPDLEVLQVLDMELSKEQEKEITSVYKLLHDVQVLSIFDELNTDDASKLKLSKVTKHRYKIDELFLKLLDYKNQKDIEQILTDLYSSTIEIINARISKAQSLKSLKTERSKVELSVYVEQLKHLIEEEKLKPKNNISFAKELQKLVIQITSETLLQKKILSTYWKELYNEVFDEKHIIGKTQSSLF